MTDLSHSFNKLKDAIYENIRGCLCERLPGNKYRWREHIGTREEIEKAIKDSGEYLKNSIIKQTT